MEVHACRYLVKSAIATPGGQVLRHWFWVCEACDFDGNLQEAIVHIVKNQFIVR